MSSSLYDAARQALDSIEEGDSIYTLRTVIAPRLRAALAEKPPRLSVAQKALVEALEDGPKRIQDIRSVVSKKALVSASRQLMKRNLIHIESFVQGMGEPSRVFAAGPRVEKARPQRAAPQFEPPPRREIKPRRDPAAAWF